MCGSTEGLQFAHVFYYPDETRHSRKRNHDGLFIEITKEPSRFLLLCLDCHRHPEPYLQELIEVRLLLSEEKHSVISIPK